MEAWHKPLSENSTWKWRHYFINLCLKDGTRKTFPIYSINYLNDRKKLSYLIITHRQCSKLKNKVTNRCIWKPHSASFPAASLEYPKRSRVPITERICQTEAWTSQTVHWNNFHKQLIVRHSFNYSFYLWGMNLKETWLKAVLDVAMATEPFWGTFKWLTF